MKYLSVCSGIESASVAWHPLGWEPLAFSEIEAFPRAVLQHHYPDTPLHGDFTVLRDVPFIVHADILVGGTPCQAFSVAGLRNSLSDERGNLSLEFVRLADAIDAARSDAGRDPGIVVWENVPGVLSTKDNAFGCFLAALAGDIDPYVPPRGKWTNAGVVDGPQRQVAWRVLDAQFFGLAQRRRRVFVVASARDGFDPAAVLLEFEGVRRDSPPRREAGQVAPTIPSRSTAGGGLWTDFDCDGGVIQAAARMVAFGEYSDDGTASTLKSRDYKDATDLVTHSLRAEGFDASEDGTGRGTPLVPVYAQELADPITAHEQKTYTHEGKNNFRTRNVMAFSAKDHGADATEDLSPTLRAMPHDGSHANGGGQVAVAYDITGTGKGTVTGAHETDVHTVLRSRPPGASEGSTTTVVAQPIPFDTTQITSPANYSKPKEGDPCHPLAAGAHPPAVAVSLRGRDGGGTAELGGDIQNALRASQGGGDKPHVLAPVSKGDAAPCVAVGPIGFIPKAPPNSRSMGEAFEQSPTVTTHQLGQGVMQHMAVRRLTPVECERLQGFPDNYTNIPWRNKPEAPDGPRYKALGNSMAVPVMRWIGRRIAEALA